mgnify:CR=1 FL=1
MTTHQVYKTLPEAEASPDIIREKSSLSLIMLLVVQIIIGYEWFMSGLVKFVRGDFPAGLADELAEKAEGAYGWYASFLDGVIIPNASNFGYLIETAEILIGVAFIAVPLIWFFARRRVPERLWAFIFLLTAVAAIGGIFMAINFHLANGYSHPWLIPADSFDEGVDFDTFLALMNIVFAAINISFFFRLRRKKN